MNTNHKFALCFSLWSVTWTAELMSGELWVTTGRFSPGSSDGSCSLWHKHQDETLWNIPLPSSPHRTGTRGHGRGTPAARRSRPVRANTANSEAARASQWYRSAIILLVPKYTTDQDLDLFLKEVSSSAFIWSKTEFSLCMHDFALVWNAAH